MEGRFLHHTMHESNTLQPLLVHNDPHAFARDIDATAKRNTLAPTYNTLQRCMSGHRTSTGMKSYGRTGARAYL